MANPRVASIAVPFVPLSFPLQVVEIALLAPWLPILEAFALLKF